MATRDRYRTKQQKIILAYLQTHENTTLTVEHIWTALREKGTEVGQTTVYRALERLVEEHFVVKIPSASGNCAQYRYVGESASTTSGKLVCLTCNKTYPLECNKLEALTRHIQADHQFEIDPRYTVLYGCCPGCAAKTKKDNL